jgi:NADPH-dependent glutamate synthase beta subunit-like oxidoreductase
MAAIYRTLLDEIERDNFHVLTQRISLTPLRKLWLAWKTYVRLTSAPRVAVIGGGWAGCAAAVELARKPAPGHAVRIGAHPRRPRARGRGAGPHARQRPAHPAGRLQAKPCAC